MSDTENNMPLVSIVIPVYNRKSITLKCLENLKTIECEGFTTLVIVVDDGSTDGTYSAIKDQYPDTIIIHGDGSLWWAGAVNLGVKYALQLNSKFVLTLNDDTTFEKDFLKELFILAMAKQSAIIGSLVAYQNSKGYPLLYHAGIVLSPLLKNISQNTISKEIIQADKFICVDGLPGRSLLIRSDIFKQLGFFNNNEFPHASADYDFTLRAKSNDIENIVAPKSVVYTHFNENNFTIYLLESNWSEYFRSFFNLRYSNNFKTLIHTSFMHKHFILGFISFIVSIARILKWTTVKLLVSNNSLKKMICSKDKYASFYFK